MHYFQWARAQGGLSACFLDSGSIRQSGHAKHLWQLDHRQTSASSLWDLHTGMTILTWKCSLQKWRLVCYLQYIRHHLAGLYMIFKAANMLSVVLSMNDALLPLSVAEGISIFQSSSVLVDSCLHWIQKLSSKSLISSFFYLPCALWMATHKENVIIRSM